jgi:hypothetical protein
MAISGCLVVPAVAVMPPQTPTSPPAIEFPPAEFGGVYMHMLLEKTLFKVDVHTLEIWLAGEEVRRIKELSADGKRSREVEDAIAEAAIHSRDAYTRLLFIRDNISLDQFVDGARENLDRVAKAGIISEDHVEHVVASLPVWYAFLAERKIRKGARMHYRVHGDTLHSQYVGVDGEMLLDQKDVGESPRLAQLGNYFVRGSSYREKLIKSLFSEH